MSEIPLESFIVVAGILFAIGTFGVLLRRNTLILFMCLELMLSACILGLIAFSRYNATPEHAMMSGNLLVLFIIAIAASEVAIGLAIIVTLWRRQQTVDVSELKALKN